MQCCYMQGNYFMHTYLFELLQLFLCWLLLYFFIIVYNVIQYKNVPELPLILLINQRKSLQVMKTPQVKVSTQRSKSRSAPRPAPNGSAKNNVGSQPSQSPSPKRGYKLSEDSFVAEMKKMREKFCNTIDAYILIFETNAPLRCLQHNSVLSLYCETQQKLLCANCIFRNGNHKQHRVFPIDKCYKQIARDIDQMTRQAQRQVTWANNTLTSILQYVKSQQKFANQAIISLAQQYEQLQFELARNFQQAKRKIMIAMDSIFNKKQPLLLQLQYFKDIFAKNKPPSLQTKTESFDKKDLPVSQNKLIFQHLIGGALLEYSRMEDNKLNQLTSKVKVLEKREVQKIKQLTFILKKFNSPERNQKY